MEDLKRLPWGENPEAEDSSTNHESSKLKRLSVLATAATLASASRYPANNWAATNQDRPASGVAKRRAKAKAARKAKQAQRRKGK